MTVSLEGKVALVTGSTRGLGREMASALARCGADVVITSRKADACELTAKEVAAESGRRTFARACHVGRWDDIDGLVADVYDEMGRIDILVNNAGMSPLYEKLTDVDEALFDKTIGVNLKGPFRLGVLIGTRMAAGDGGTMVHVSSTASVRPKATYLPYAAAKAGLNVMSEGLARAFGPSVRSNVVMAGPFETEITAGWDWDAFNRKAQEFALQRIGQPHEIVGAVLYLCSGASSYTTGTVLTVNGGEP
jgi:NAD(P)-dependent dehydrogenase (short-subunit alcohol dehydrogenase family)